MANNDMSTKIDAQFLAAAFPSEIHVEAILVGSHIMRSLIPFTLPQMTDRFVVQVMGQPILIPKRLYFALYELRLSPGDTTWLIARALQTRAGDGFMRQKALRHLLAEPTPWTAPYIVALIGEYVIEILEDIDGGMTAELERTLGEFIADNPGFWQTIRHRVTSYWNAYYRYPYGDDRRAYSRAEYVGFRLVNRLGRAAAKTG